MSVTAPDITVSIPRTWTSRSDPAHGIVIAARARELPASSFAPEIVVRTAPVDDYDLVSWRSAALTTLADQLEAFDLEDEDAAVMTRVLDTLAAEVLKVRIDFAQRRVFETRLPAARAATRDLVSVWLGGSAEGNGA